MLDRIALQVVEVVFALAIYFLPAIIADHRKRHDILTLALFKSILEEPELGAPDRPFIGIALQAYLRDCEEDLRDLLTWARERRRPLNVRLVKGAYWDFEPILARQRSWPEALSRA